MTDGTLISGVSDMMPKGDGDVKGKQGQRQHECGAEADAVPVIHAVF
jgi:hypothetical protein